MTRFFTRAAGVLIFALSLTPGTLAEDAASVSSSVEPALVVAAADGLMNVAVYDALKSAGVDEEKARAAARSVAFPERDQLATKADLVALQAVTKADLASLRAVTKADLAALQAVNKADLAEMEARLIWAGAGAMGLILTLLVGLFAMIVGVWRKIADLAEKMPPPTPAR